MAYGSTAYTGGTGSVSDASSSTNLFDGNLTTYAGFATGVGWFKYDYGVGIKKLIKKYRIYVNSDFTFMPKDWTFEGSNDDSAWTVLNTQTNQTWASPQWAEYTPTSTTAYRYNRFNVTANNGAGSTLCFEWQAFQNSDFLVLL